MPPTDRFVTAFAAEPPQDELPYGRWADRLRVEFLAACLRIDDEGEDLGQAGDVTWYPDRTYGGRTYVPATAAPRPATSSTATSPSSRASTAATRPTSTRAPTSPPRSPSRTPDWKLDLCEDVIGVWRGENGKVGADDARLGAPAGPRRQGRHRGAREARRRPVHASSRTASRSSRPTTTAATCSTSSSGAASTGSSPPSRSTRTTTRTRTRRREARGGRPHPPHPQGLRGGAGLPCGPRGALRARPLGAEPPRHEPLALPRRRARRASLG